MRYIHFKYLKIFNEFKQINEKNMMYIAGLTFIKFSSIQPRDEKRNSNKLPKNIIK